MGEARRRDVAVSAEGAGAGSLRAELEIPSPPDRRGFVFTGSGREYFRIWIVNLLFTVLTLGIYSPWAKVRKAKYFWQNTRLDGHVFDFHGRPSAILRGRLIAIVLLAAYTWSFQFSKIAGLVTVVVLCAAGPWLFMRAQQFRLGNTSFRGLRFGFRSNTAEAYRVGLPVLSMWLLPAVVVGVGTEDRWLVGVAGLTNALFIPWMHHRLKGYQHQRATYGDRAFAFSPVTSKFYSAYVKGMLFVLLGSVIGGVLVGVIAVFWRTRRLRLEGWSAETVILGAVMGLAVYVVAWPYLAARLQQAVWASTRLSGFRFRTEIKASSLMFLVIVNVGLTVLTLGLYWPFAAVTLARYRIECMRMYAGLPLDVVAADVHAMPVTAAGEAALETFGLDVGI